MTGRELKEIRSALNLSRDQFIQYASAKGITKQYLTNWENGTHIPEKYQPIVNIIILYWYMGLDPTEALKGDFEPQDIPYEDKEGTLLYSIRQKKAEAKGKIHQPKPRTAKDIIKELQQKVDVLLPFRTENEALNKQTKELNDLLAQKEHTIAVLTKELDTVKLTCTKLEDTCAVKDERLNALEQQCKMFSRIILTLQDLLDKQ